MGEGLWLKELQAAEWKEIEKATLRSQEQEAALEEVGPQLVWKSYWLMRMQELLLGERSMELDGLRHLEVCQG